MVAYVRYLGFINFGFKALSLLHLRFTSYKFKTYAIEIGDLQETLCRFKNLSLHYRFKSHLLEIDYFT